MNGMKRKTSDPRKNIKIPVLMAVIMLVSVRAPAMRRASARMSVAGIPEMPAAQSASLACPSVRPVR